LVSAGHFYPLLVSSDGAHYVSGEIEPPVGVATPTCLRAVTIGVPSSGTLLAFTDGAIERKGEGIDIGLERLRVAAANHDGPIEATLDRLLADVVSDGADDDVVIVGLRWGS
jgi:serine phosphatase RsbU (regulator of sigma subunit)